MSNDSELILSLQSGSLDALGELYDRHKHLVYRTALMITGDTEAAADLLQDVFLRLYRFASHVDPLRPLEPWLYRMTANLSYTWVKRSRRWLPSLEEVAEWLVGSRKNPGQASQDQDEEWLLIEQAISELPYPQRVVVILYYVNDLSLLEISEIMDIPVGTVKSRLYYGREIIKKQLGLTAKDKLKDLQCEFT
jgi:RNA polymerase sigma-70 factor (ECF subfamily)